jgi:hypothetical protein
MVGRWCRDLGASNCVDWERAEAALSFAVPVDEWSELHLVHRRKRHREGAQRPIGQIFAGLLKRPAARMVNRYPVRRQPDKLRV